MKLDPGQKKKLRALIALSTQLADEVRAMVDRRHQKVRQLQDAKLEAKKHQDRADSVANERFMGLSEELRAERIEEFTGPAREAEENVSGIEGDLNKLEEQIEAAHRDASAAGQLAQKLLDYSGEKHEDVPRRVDLHTSASRDLGAAGAASAGSPSEGSRDQRLAAQAPDHWRIS